MPDRRARPAALLLSMPAAMRGVAVAIPSGMLWRQIMIAMRSPSLGRWL